MDPIYHYREAKADHTHAYLLPIVANELARAPPPARLLDLGCGNGFTTNAFAAAGYDVVGLDPSPEGIGVAKMAHPGLRFAEASAYDDLATKFGRFDVVVSLEVVEHLLSPKAFAERVRDVLQSGGVAIISTPYHGYLKHLALAASGKMDAHHDPLWEGGHIKFWSRAKLTELFRRVDLEEVAFHRVGRIPQLAKSMVATFRKTA